VKRAWVLTLVLLCVVAAAPAGAQDKPAATDQAAAVTAPSEQTLESLLQSVTHPLPWFSWGGELRLRQEAYNNVIDLLDSGDDRRNYFRIRAQLWTQFGPFFKDEALDKPNGLTAYVRTATEPRYFLNELPTDHVPMWTEVFLDNAYVQWQRPAGWPVTVKVGRQDIVYGRGFVLKDGTPLDGSRSIFMDAVKATLHLDGVQTDVDFLAIDNRGRGDGYVTPWGYHSHKNRFLQESNATVLGAYLINRTLAPHEFHAYYLYKDEDTISTYALPDRTVHTIGALAQGSFPIRKVDLLDYYGEAAVQWGKEGSQSRRAFGLNGDVGYTFQQVLWRPRVHVNYMFLSGDDPDTSRFEGWDPVLARYIMPSEILAFRAASASEYGRYAYHTNMIYYGTGIRVNPTARMRVDLDYILVGADEHDKGTAFPFSNGKTRGNVYSAILTYTFNPRVSGHLWAEYYQPGGYYASSTDPAYFLRWQLVFKL
jgi:hypothetical protein